MVVHPRGSDRRIGDDEFIAETGSYILKPRRIPCTFWNPDYRPARILEIVTPSGPNEMFVKLGRFGARGQADAGDDGRDSRAVWLDAVDGLSAGVDGAPRVHPDGLSYASRVPPAPRRGSVPRSRERGLTKRRELWPRMNGGLGARTGGQSTGKNRSAFSHTGRDRAGWQTDRARADRASRAGWLGPMG